MEIFNGCFSNLKEKMRNVDKPAPVVATVMVPAALAAEDDALTALRKKISIVADLSFKEARETHNNQQTRTKAIAFEVLEAKKNIKKLDDMLKGMPGESREKNNVLKNKQDLEKGLDNFSKQLGVKEMIEVIKITSEVSEGKHFGDLSRVLVKVVKKNLGHKENMSFEEARKNFPASIIILFGGCSYVIEDRDLGKELIFLRQRAIAAKKAEAAKKLAAAAEKK